MKYLDRIFILSLCLLFLPLFNIQAQNSSTLGWFEINYIQGCSPLQISVKTSISENDVPIFQFNGMDDTNPIAWRDSFDSLNHIYTSPGRYMVYLTVQTNNVTRQDSLSVTVFQSEIPVFDLKNCEAYGLTVDIQDNFYDSYIVDFGDGTSTTVNSGAPDPVHLYSDSQSYIVQVTGKLTNAPNNCGSLSTSFTPAVELLLPTINRLITTEGNEIQLNFNLPQNVDYRLEATAGNTNNFQFLQFLQYPDTTITLTGFSPVTQRYCFRIGALDACSGNLLYSNSICTIKADLNIANNINRLSWNTLEFGLNEESYQISRNAIPDFIVFPTGTFNFNDQQVNCSTDYCYTVTTLYTNGAESVAPTVCGTSFSTDTPPSTDNLSVDIRTDGALITWDALPGIDTSYIEQFSSSGLKLNQASTISNPVFLSADLKNFPQTCYLHTYLDVCGNNSKRITAVCSILLTGVSDPDGSISLNWSEYAGWKEGVASYTIEKSTKSGDLIESIPMALNTSYVDEIDGNQDQIVNYAVRAIAIDETLPTIVSNEIDIARRAQLHYPNAFTPDGDGLNDIFKPTYLFISKYSLSIYNRWGELIFSSNELELGWDGQINGVKALEGNYTYLTKAEDFRGLKISRSGIVLLMRK